MYSNVPPIISDVTGSTFLWLGAYTEWSDGTPTRYFIQAVLRVESNEWKAEFWIPRPNDYARYHSTDIYANLSTDSEIYYSIEINCNTREVFLL